MFTPSNLVKANHLHVGHIILFDGRYYVVHKAQLWVTDVDLCVNAIDSLTADTRVETISLPAELFVVIFDFQNKMK